MPFSFFIFQSQYLLLCKNALRRSMPRVLLTSAVTLIMGMSAGKSVFAADFPAVIDLPDLLPGDGFLLNAVSDGDRSGTSVNSAGDLNGDGVDDLVVGASFASVNGFASGSSYVVFGGSDVGDSGMLELSSLDGSSGFVLNGTFRIESGTSVASAGDLNGDGMTDLVIGASGGGDDTVEGRAAAYVVFGGGGVGSTAVLELSELNGEDGFIIFGVDNRHRAGVSVGSAGDLNADGVDDLLIGAHRADPNGFQSGASYVVFGNNDVGSSGVLELSDLDGSNGFVLNGVNPDDNAGRFTRSAGDINDDGVVDLVIGAASASPNGFRSGASYVVFGGSGVGSAGVLELSDLNGSNGFVLNGADERDRAGSSVDSAGDINNDGVDDLLIGAFAASANGLANAGQGYVVFGGSGVGSTGALELSELNGINGFVLNGVKAWDQLGAEVRGVGDVNGDTVDDLMISAGPAGLPGMSYVVFGESSVGSTGVLEMSALDGSNGLVLNGGASLSSALDVNADGVGDLLIAAPFADGPNGETSGQSYVVFGIAQAQQNLCNGLAITVDLNLGDRPTSGDDVILGTPAADKIIALGGNDTICGEGGDDIINAGPGNDWVKGDAGDDVIRGGAGDDELFGEAGDDLILGHLGDDTIDGGGGLDSIAGGDGSDIIYTGSGDTVGSGVFASGGSGNDMIFGGIDADDIRGDNGADTIEGNRGDDLLNGGSGRDLVSGGPGNDVVGGGAGSDTVQGGADDDVVRGGGGIDIVLGGEGDDILAGGASPDDVCDGQQGVDIALSSCESVIIRKCRRTKPSHDKDDIFGPVYRQHSCRCRTHARFLRNRTDAGRGGQTGVV